MSNYFVHLLVVVTVACGCASAGNDTLFEEQQFWSSVFSHHQYLMWVIAEIDLGLAACEACLSH